MATLGRGKTFANTAQCCVIYCIAALMLGLTAVLIWAIREEMTNRLDAEVLRVVATELRAWHWPIVASHALSFISGYMVRLPIALACVVALLRREDRSAAILISAATLGPFIGAAVLQEAIDRPRPELIDPLVHYDTGSFPSGHAASTIAAFGAIAWAAARHGALPRAVYPTVIIFSLAVGVSRLVLAAHWPTDVLAGWLLGLGWLLLCVAVACHYESRQSLFRVRGALRR